MAPFSRLISTTSTLGLAAVSCLAEGLAVRSGLQERRFSLSRGSVEDQYRLLPPVQSTHGSATEEKLELLDICLLASVDGKFHALNRTSGQILWSMSPSLPGSSPSALMPLVRTEHADYDPSVDEGEHRELYIIEPQTGDIYVLPEPNAALQLLPYSMPQLVDMSPFSFTGDDEGRVFVGKKETSLLMLELETGHFKGAINADSECPWDPFGESEDTLNGELDLDELDGTKPKKPVSTTVLIGRTDYRVSIHTRAPRHGPKPPVQNLTFSTYGPNNQDHIIQSGYRRTPDDMYIQPLPNGELMSFLAPQRENGEYPESRPLWAHNVPFRSPIVAVFDVLNSPSRPHPLVLIQPTPRLQDFIPQFDVGNLRSDLEATFIGLEETNGSLFAMSPEQFPLVLFHQQTNHAFSRPTPNIRRPTIDAPPGEITIEKDTDFEDIMDLPVDIDGVGRLLKERGCRDSAGHGDRSCLTGKRPVEASGPSRLSRLLPDRAAAEEQHRRDHEWQVHEGPDIGLQDGNASRDTIKGTLPVNDDLSAGRRLLESAGRPALTGAVAAFAIFLVGLWYLMRKAGIPKHRGSNMKAKPAPIEVAARNHLSDTPDGSNNMSLTADVPTKSSQPVVKVLDFASDTPAVPKESEDFRTVPRLQPQEESPKPPAMKMSNGNGQVAAAANDKPSAPELAEDAEGDEESDREPDNLGTPGKKKGPRRRKRGKKGKGANANQQNDDPGAANSQDEKKEDEAMLTPVPISLSISANATQNGAPPQQQLQISDEVLGYGSHGTVVYRGSLQGRAVAVKRLLQDFVTLAAREVNILQESDDHPNVIRYYYQEAHAGFLYIALELCPCSLADVIERPDQHREISNAFDPKRALSQITSGLRHIHALKIIHRDIKPQNILISSAKKGAGASAGHRMLISDFGLCKKLEVDQTSFYPTAYGAMAAGTVGWRAPEILKGEVKLDDTAVDDSTLSSRGSTGTAVNVTSARSTRLTKSVDIFALGCLFYYTLTGGGHPYGDRYEREVNIMKDVKTLGSLEVLGEEGLEAIDLITQMLDPEASERPNTTDCLTHPFFWTAARRLAFLQDASDRFEIMCRDPKDADLIELELNAHCVVGNDWQSRIDKIFLDNLGKFRKYDGKSVQDLMRALRNKKHHYQDLPDNVKRHLGPLPDGFLQYFTRRFPHLFMHVHSVVSRTNLRYEMLFKSYFELPE